MSTSDAALALRRFGLGARPGEIARIASDPRGFVLGQLARPEAARITVALEPGHAILAEVQGARRELQAARKEAGRQAQKLVMPGAAREPSPTSGTPPAMPPAAAPPSASAEPMGPRAQAAKKGEQAAPRPARLQREAFVADVEARITHAVATDSPFLERLVLFWSSHFAVSAGKGIVRGIAGAYEREAIRPHVLGHFSDMLKAAAQHPAMLIYLDNARSIGPKSQVGQRNQRGLNENLAREILELHTLGVDGGYTQADVTALARLLTGWSIGVPELAHTRPGHFFFAAPRHEPGGATVLGRQYSQGGLAEGEAALADLARHPSTARHVARKLARHFVADAAAPALMQRLEQTFRDTDGDLAALARVLASAPEAWSPPPSKIVPPYDYLVSLARGVAPGEPTLEVHRLAAALGQPTWTPPSPKGWPDDDEAWTGPAAIRERLRIAEMAARRASAAADARLLGPELLGGLLSEATRQAVARAETREQGVELLVMSPEFLRR
jgi:uncharacterized protein (DUF1800 family)